MGESMNKPVAWMHQNPDYAISKHQSLEYNIPLYTHPSEHDLGIAEAIGFEKGHKSAEDMLRQQQAEIEALKAGKIRAYDNGVEDGRKPNTNPVKEELTDEEIEIEWFKVFKPETGIGKNLTNGVYEFARAILKKAKE